MVTPNTTYQRLNKKWNGTIVSGNVTGEGATLQTHKETGGTFIANGASTVTIVDSNVGTNSIVAISLQVVGGTVGSPPIIKTITPGTGFTVTCTASDTSTYGYLIIG